MTLIEEMEMYAHEHDVPIMQKEGIDFIQPPAQSVGNILHPASLIVRHPRQTLASQSRIDIALRRHIAAHHNQLFS